MTIRPVAQNCLICGRPQPPLSFLNDEILVSGDGRGLFVTLKTGFFVVVLVVVVVVVVVILVVVVVEDVLVVVVAVVVRLTFKCGFLLGK